MRKSVTLLLILVFLIISSTATALPAKAEFKKRLNFNPNQTHIALINRREGKNNKEKPNYLTRA
jgi:hypothetical protein